jgi:WD40 repeat protein
MKSRNIALRTQQDAQGWQILSPDGFLVAVVNHELRPAISVSLLGEEQPLVTYVGHRGGLYGRTPHITALAWSPDGTRITSGAADGSLQVWDARRGIHQRTLIDRDEESPVESITWEGETIRAACGKTVREWHA